MDTMRIFVGGLGEGVTDDDLRRMFVALGSVDEIEIIRNKGRSMAYLNYTPSSAKSLAKLFSSFNGCVWKGGKLRIEKAKEHYLVKMEREREKEREEEIARNDALMKRTAEVVTLKKLTKGPGAEKEQIRIFFPKLRKVKPLPFSGCGKHKYSFRNIPVPPLPTHFCDCELHYVPYDAPIKTGGVDEKEFDLMHSLCNKLISKDEGAGSNGIGGPSSASDYILASEKNAADSEPDEDGIVINISGAMNEPDFSWKSKDKYFSEYQGSNDNHPQAFEVDDRRWINSNKKRKLEGRNEAVDQSLKKKKKDDLNAASALSLGSNSLRTKSPKWKELVGVGTDSSFRLSNVFSRGAVQELVQQQDTKNESSKSEDPNDETEAYADKSAHDTKEDLSSSEETDDEAGDPTGESGKLDSEEESNKSEESGNEVEEDSSGEFAKQEDAEEESSKSEEYDYEVKSSDDLAEHEDTEDKSNKLEESDDEVEQESSDDLAEQEDSEDESNDLEEEQEDSGDESNDLEESNDEVEQEASDDLAKQEDTGDELDKSYDVAKESSDELAGQEDTKEASTKLEQHVTKHGDNKQLKEVKLTDTEDGSVKKGATWSQVMPWNQLVSDLDNSSFSISQILPSSSANQVAVKPSNELKDGGTHQSSKAVKVDITTASDVYLMNTTTDLHEQKNLSNSAPQNSPYEAAKSEDEKPTKPIDSAPKPVVRADTYVNRPFVRSAASLKEWAKLKETLRKSGTKKRKTPEE